MSLRRTSKRLVSVSLPGGDEISNQTMYNQILYKRKKAPGFKGWSSPQYLNAAIIGGVIVGGYVVIGPWVRDESAETFGYKNTIVDHDHMPHLTISWWENEWRKMQTTWRKGEYKADFHKEPYEYIQSIVGRDMADEPLRRYSQHFEKASSSSWWKALLGGRKNNSVSTSAPTIAPSRALVPLCGDSPIIRLLLEQGYQVDAVDASESAIRSCVEKLEVQIPQSAFHRLTLHFKDFFAASLWNSDLAGRKYDFIYDRQALSVVAPNRREDYAYLLKQALKDDGILYVEGIFRTGRVKGNKVKGPPFGLSRAQLRDLFPERDGYFVQCRDAEDNAVKLLDVESKVLRRVPKSLHVTSFPCVVFREAGIGAAPPSVAAQSRDTVQRTNATSAL